MTSTSPRPRVLVVDDEENISYLVSSALRLADLEAATASTGEEALAKCTPAYPDVVVLDVMLPDLDGFEVLRRLRAKGVEAPVLFLTARADTADRVRGLTAGGDDYITKPFALEELVARVHVALRRRGGSPAPSGRHQVHDLVLDEDQHRVWRGNTEHHLTATEFTLLRCLLVNAGRVVTRAQILDHVWQYDFSGESAIIESFVSTLRKKVDATGPKLIHTVRGVGYTVRGAVMTLRRRLVIATSALAVVLFVAGTAVVLVQRAFLVGRLDSQLVALAQNPRAILLASARAEAAGAGPAAGLSDVWVGRMSADGTLTPVLTPQADPDLVPRLAPGEKVTAPQGRPTASGTARRVRVLTATLPNGRAQAVLAIPTTSADAATRSLALTLALVGLAVATVVGLLLWWVDRLGLRPIAQMTDAADAITAGDMTRRVPPGPPGTEAARLGEALNAMIDTTAVTQERMRRFVADASHELRTPLTTLQGYAALHGGRAALADEPGGSTAAYAGAPDARTVERQQAAGTVERQQVSETTERQQVAEMADAMRRIGDEAARMRRLVDALLDLARLDDLGVVARDPVDLAVVVRDVASDLRVVAPDRLVTVEAPESLVVNGDRDRLTQALVGLTSNAVRHTPGGTPVRLGVVELPGAVRVDVADAGPGIPPEHLAHVFERFHRVDRGRSSASGGTGLGLAIVDAIAQAHGGRASVVSTPGRGATFSLTLPTNPD